MKYPTTEEIVEETGFKSDLRYELARDFAIAMLANPAIQAEGVPIKSLQLANEFLSEVEKLGYITEA